MTKKRRGAAHTESSDFSNGLLPNGRRYDFTSMEVGQGVFCPTLKDAKSLIACAHNYAKKNPGFKMSRRQVHGGYKVWRTA